MTSAPSPATLPNTSKHIQLWETELWFGSALSPPHETESGGTDRAHLDLWEPNWVGLGFFILKNDTFSSGAGLGRCFFCYTLCLLRQHMAEESILDPDLSPLPPSAFISYPGGIRPLIKQNRDMTQSVCRTLFWDLMQTTHIGGSLVSSRMQSHCPQGTPSLSGRGMETKSSPSLFCCVCWNRVPPLHSGGPSVGDGMGQGRFLILTAPGFHYI